MAVLQERKNTCGASVIFVKILSIATDILIVNCLCTVMSLYQDVKSRASARLVREVRKTIIFQAILARNRARTMVFKYFPASDLIRNVHLIALS